MVTSFKLRTLALIFAVLAGVGGIIGAVLSAGEVKLDNGKTIVLDAGHGGGDGGAKGILTSAKESDINLAIVKKLNDFLVDAGYNVVLTRKNSEGLYSSFDKNKKTADMQKRRSIIEEAKPDMIVSIHQNSYPRALVRGPQVFYAPSSETGKEYAGIMQRILNSGLGSSRVEQKGDYYMLQCTQYPSLLVECGFLSNATDEKLLLDAKYQQKVAYLIFSGIHSIIFDGELTEYDYLYKT
jgi:N-acetylmuramoyl-L-alanine amidase